MQVITSQLIFDGENLLENKAILIDNNQIIEVIDRDNLSGTENIEDFGDLIITPGFIDLQLNGCGGVLFNEDITHNTLETMYQTCLRYGTTSFLPTLISCQFDDVITALNVVKDWFENYGNSRGVLGIHLEGPFLSIAKKGIHPEEFIIKPTTELLSQIITYTRYFPIMMTIAVEEFTLEQIKFLVDNGIILAVGHSNANYQQVAASFMAGLTNATHLFNAMSGLTGRNPGVIGAVLNNNIYTGIISDNLHVAPANVELVVKLKPDHTFLVTDAVTPIGTDMKQFKLAGKTIYVDNEGKCIDETGTLGGANITLPQSIKNCINSCNIDLTEALKMATIIPAKAIRQDQQFGRIAKGYNANLVALNLAHFTCNII